MKLVKWGTRYKIDREHKITKSVPALGDYISTTIRDRDLIQVAINRTYCFRLCY